VEELAERLPAYQILRLLGRGGMGAVYQGVQLSLARPVAIKLLSPDLAASPDFVSRFQREARTLARLQHPGIVTVHDFGSTPDGHLYFVMEFVDGTDLQQVIQGAGLEPAQALELTLQVCEALQYAHSQGVIHRDIKPANVLLTQEGRAKLADFGLARPITLAPGMTAASMVMGTPGYMAPEQLAGKIDHRADIYALGVMLYEMLTGSPPMGAFDLPSVRAHVDARLDQVVIKAMRQAPEQRYQNVSELRDEVQRIRTTRPPHPARPSSAAAAARKPAPRRSLLDTFGWVAAAVLVLAFLGAGFWLLRQEQQAGKKPASTTAPANPGPEVAPASAESVEKPSPAPATSGVGKPSTPAITPALRTELQAAVRNQEPTTIQARPAAPSPPAMPAPSPPPAVTQSTPTPTVPASPPPVLEVFTRESQNLVAWALSPLESTVPPDIRQNLTFIREDLVDEGKTKPVASLDAYRAAYYLCEDLLSALNEREQARVTAGYRAAQTAAATPTGSQALDARRNYLMSWPQYEREQSQRGALTSQNQARENLSGEAQKVGWAARSARLRTTLDTRYRAFRAALRQ
jgi:serine/threonine protein kinase